MTVERVETIELVTMGCAWVLDVRDLPPESAAQMADRWGRAVGLHGSDTPLLDPQPQTVRVHEGPARVDAGGASVGADDPERVAYVVSREVTRLGLIRLRGRVALLHAAALADGAGRTLALVAPSGGGKSTATRVLGQRLGYVSDETLVLLADDRIAPHPKPPSLVIDERDRWHKREPSPDELGLGPTPPTPRLAALLTLARDPDATEPAIEEVGLIDQLLAILPETSSAWWVDAGLDRLARAVTVGGPPARLRYAEIDTCHELVRGHLERAAPVAPTWEHFPAKGADRLPVDVIRPESQDPEQVALDETARVVRAPWSDAIACDGEVLVLAGSRPIRLAGPGAIIWREAEVPVPLATLAERVVEELGEHPDADDLVRAATVQLVSHGLLRRS